MSENFITIGRLMRPHGVRGEIKCMPASHDLDRHRLLRMVVLSCADGTRLSLPVEKSSRHGEVWHLKFKGYDSPEQAQALVNAEVLVSSEERLPPPPGQYYFSDLEGLRVLDEAGMPVGTVLGVQELPSVNALVLRIGTQEVLAPWVDACVESIDLAARTVRVRMDYLSDLLGDARAH